MRERNFLSFLSHLKRNHTVRYHRAPVPSQDKVRGRFGEIRVKLKSRLLLSIHLPDGTWSNSGMHQRLVGSHDPTNKSHKEDEAELGVEKSVNQSKSRHWCNSSIMPFQGIGTGAHPVWRWIHELAFTRRICFN